MADVSSPPRIVRLPAPLVNQIAAGEVVERAASVVKELCENSIDAGARRIDVEIAGGGRTLIRIIDDGCGMTPEEARLALERHATSKIREAEDLWGVQTFGFRGEALPSIASVSRLTVKTCPVGAAAGFMLEVHAGQEVQAVEVGMPAGTQIEVRDLFYNTPARLKFQKTEATETSNVSEALLRLALANPDVHVRLRVNGRPVMDLPPHRDLAERVRAAMAKRGAGVLHEAVGDENGVCVHAFLAAPECGSTTSRNTFTFVGRRFVRDRSLLQALCMGYGDSLEKGRYPLAILFVDVPGEDLDVNVHPQKMEVRFAQPQPVYAAVRHVLAAALTHAPWAARDRAYSLAPGTSGKNALAARAHEEAAADLGKAFVEPVAAWPSVTAASSPEERQRPSGLSAHAGPGLVTRAIPPAVAPTDDRLSQHTWVGTFADRFILLQDQSDGLLMLDHAAAAECATLHALREALSRGHLSEQRLLFPIPIEVDENATRAFEASAPAWARLGFDVGMFGPLVLLVRAVPEVAANADPKPLVLELLHTLTRGRGEPCDDVPEAALATLVRYACKGQNALDAQRARALLVQLDAFDWRRAMSRDRPFCIRLPLAELERRFGRT